MALVAAFAKTGEHALLSADDSATTNGTAFDTRDTGLLVLRAVAAASWDGTLNFEVTEQAHDSSSSTWITIQGENVSTGAAVTTAAGTTLDAAFRFDVSGFQGFRSRVSGQSTGNITARGRGVGL